MMFDRLQDQKWIVYVLPGFLALFVAGFISDFPEIRDVLIPFVYVALTGLSLIVPLGLTVLIAKFRRTPVYATDLPSNGWFVSGVFAFSILVGFAFGAAHSTDFVSTWLRSVLGKDAVLVSSHTEPLRLLMREAYQPNFVERFDGIPSTYVSNKEPNIFVAITTGVGENALVSHGVVHSFHSHSENPQAYLSPACQEVSSEVIPVRGPGLWVDLQDAQTIEFIYQACSPCAAALKAETGNGPLITSCPFEKQP